MKWLDAISLYRMATENEVAIDEHFYNLLRSTPGSFGYCPRPEKWLAKYRKYQKVIFLVSPPVRMLWMTIGFSVFFFLQSIKEFSRWALSKPVYRSNAKIPTYFLLLSPQAEKLIRTSSMAIEVDYFLELPWNKVSTCTKRNQSVNPLAHLTAFDFITVYFLSLRTATEFIFKAPKWALQSYTAYRWLLVCRALQRLGASNYIITQHFDRWAVLVDGLVSHFNLSQGEVKLTLVQHGELKNLSSSNNTELPFKLPNRLHSVSKLCAFDEPASQLFLKNIIDNPTVQVEYFEPKLEIYDLQKKDKATILFVGNPNCKDLHVSLYNQLKMAGTHFIGYYKPHPGSLKDSSLTSVDWDVLQYRNDYPRVDLVISYPSTLARQYNLVNVPTIVHPIDLSPENSNNLVGEIIQKIEGINTVKTNR